MTEQQLGKILDDFQQDTKKFVKAIHEGKSNDPEPILVRAVNTMNKIYKLSKDNK